MPNVTAYLLAALAVALLVAGAAVKGYHMGQDNIRAEYAARDLQQANEAAAATKAVEEKYRAQEQAHAQALSQVSATYQGKLTDAQAKTTTALNAIRSGSIRMRDPGAVSKADCGSTASTVTAASGRDGDTQGGLSGTASEFLLTLAADADRNTLQLAACQAVVEADRR